MKGLVLVSLILGAMLVVVTLVFASEDLGPLGSLLMVVFVFVIFAAVGLNARSSQLPSVLEEETDTPWVTGAPLSTTDWMAQITTQAEMERLIKLEVERSRRFDRQFTVLVVAPDLGKLSVINADVSSPKVLDAYRLFIQEILVRQLRSTDVIANSRAGSASVVLLPETDSDGTEIAIARIRKVMTETDLMVGSEERQRMEISVMASSYPNDVTDTVGVLEQIDLFEQRNRFVPAASN